MAIEDAVACDGEEMREFETGIREISACDPPQATDGPEPFGDCTDGTDPPSDASFRRSLMLGLRAPGSRSVYSRGICQSDEYGMKRYNIEDIDEVYISRQSSKAMSNDDDLVLIRATDGNYVIQPGAVVEIPDNPDEPPADERTLFSNVTETHFCAYYRGITGTLEEGMATLERDGITDTSDTSERSTSIDSDVPPSAGGADDCY